MKYYLIVAVLTVGNLYGQGTRLKLGNEAFAVENYFDAKEFYLDYLSKTNDSIRVHKNLGICYDELNNPSEASKYLLYGHSNNLLDEEGLRRLIYTSIELKDYETANKYAGEYIDLFGNSKLPSSLRQDIIFSDLQINKYNFNVVDSSLSTIYSEIGINYIDDNRFLIAKNERRQLLKSVKNGRTDEYFYDLYIVEKLESNKNDWDYVKIGSKKAIRYNDGPACFLPSTNEIYFTRSYFDEGKYRNDDSGFVDLKLYRGKLEKGDIVSEELLSINEPNISMGHPSVSSDGKWLYFASDRSGGFGGVDIYRSSIGENGVLGSPENLGEKINTSQDELFPNIHASNNLLFFSSDGHVGLGGLDNFVAKLSPSLTVLSIENFGSPINSSLDDFGFISNSDQTEGYFCSARNQNKNDNIYTFNQGVPIKVSEQFWLATADYLTGEKLGSVSLNLNNLTSNRQLNTNTSKDGFTEYSEGEKGDQLENIFQKENYLLVTQNVTLEHDTIQINMYPDINQVAMLNVQDSNTKQKVENYSLGIEDKNGDVKSIDPYMLKDELIELMKSKSAEELKNYQIVYSSPNYLTEKINAFDYINDFKLNNETFAPIDLIKINEGVMDLATEYQLDPIYFDLNSSYIRPDAKLILDKIVLVLKNNPGISIELTSHTDTRATNLYNKWLSQRRAEHSKEYLVERGISSSRISAIGNGEMSLKITDEEIELLNSEDQKEKAHQKNRRTEFLVVK